MAAFAVRDEQPPLTPTNVSLSKTENFAAAQPAEQHRVDHRPTAHRMSQLEIQALINQLRDLTQALPSISVEDRRAVYDELGVSLSYQPESKTVGTGAGAPHVLRVGVGGATHAITPRADSGWISVRV